MHQITEHAYLPNDDSMHTNAAHCCFAMSSRSRPFNTITDRLQPPAWVGRDNVYTLVSLSVCEKRYRWILNLIIIL